MCKDWCNNISINVFRFIFLKYMCFYSARNINLLCCTYLFYNRLISPYMHRLCNILCINLAAHPKIIRIQMILM